MTRRPIASLSCSVAAGALFCWVAVWNGQPFFYGDTPAYVRGPDYAIHKLLGPRFATAWTAPEPTPRVERQESASPPHEAAASAPESAAPTRARGSSLSSVEDGTVLAGRSVYYGALLYAGHLLGGFWVSVLFQGVLVASVLSILLRVLVDRPLRHLAVLATVLAAGSPLPFFVGFLLPDVLAGAATLSAAALFAFAGRLQRGEMLWLTAVMCFAAVSHASHVLLLAALTLFGLAGAAGRHDPRRPSLRVPLTAVAATMLVTFLAGLVFSAAVLRATGMPPLRPPFLTARTVIDGPGARFIDERCPQAGFAICDFAEKRPRSVNEFLWSLDPERGVFPLASADERRALSDEQFRFAFTAAMAHPGLQMDSSTRNFAAQLTMVGLPEFVYETGAREWFRLKLPAAHYQQLTRTRAYAEALPVGPLASAYAVVAALSLASILIGFRRNRAGPGSTANPPEREFRWFVALVLLGVVANAAICGVLATPHHRYQARMLWLLPCLAVLADFRWRRNAWSALLGRGDRGA